MELRGILRNFHGDSKTWEFEQEGMLTALAWELAYSDSEEHATELLEATKAMVVL